MFCRRALKATFVLIPLFGIQWALIIYRVEQAVWYEVIRSIIQNTQVSTSCNRRSIFGAMTDSKTYNTVDNKYQIWLCDTFYDLSALVGCWSLVSIRRIIYKVLNRCPFNCTAFLVNRKDGTP